MEFDVGLETKPLSQLLVSTAFKENTVQSLVLTIHHGKGTGFQYFVGESAEKSVGDLGGLDKYLVSLLESAGVSDEEMSKLFKSRIWHEDVFPKRSRRSFRSAG
jgi:hypothetical protein